MNLSKSSYHHGDLRSSLLVAATELIRENGVDGLSMRKLADRVGVSRTAPYHHFVDKQALLSALAETGFANFQQQLSQSLQTATSPREQLRFFLGGYLTFAREHPETYNLMFGQPVWQTGTPSDSLKQQAYGCFRYFVEQIAGWQTEGLLPSGVEPLRFTQLTWSTLHGLARLLIDGIYVDDHNLDELLSLAERLFCAELLGREAT